MTDEKRLEEIKEDTHPHNNIYSLPKGKELVIYEKDFNYLIKKAETLRKIADTWVSIETNGTPEDAENFYTDVQNILGGETE